MPTLTIAAIQMDVGPAPTVERLTRAERLVEQAAGEGAQLIVLPELFNIGYTYEGDNFHKAEPRGGPSDRWMNTIARRLGVHLAGSLLLTESGDIYNTLLLHAPDGRSWRYDKRYPWGWERGYFRAGRGGTVVADTDLGRIGMLICWDSGHLNLWRAYAGQVDLMLITSCPPDVGRQVLEFGPDRVELASLGGPLTTLKESAPAVFDTMINEQAAWLGAPVVNTVGCGQVDTPIPNPLGSLLAYLPLAPQLIQYLGRVGTMRMTCTMTEACKIVDMHGTVVVSRPQSAGEGMAIASVMLGGAPHTNGAQPAARVSPLAYLSSDFLLPALSLGTYRRGIRQLWPGRAADSQRGWVAMLLLALVAVGVRAWRKRAEG
jgi:hypothetical protein